MLERDYLDLATVDWDELAQVRHASDRLLARLDTDRPALAALFEHAATDPKLLSLSERLDHLDKVVLHDDRTGWRLRAHFFRQDCQDWPHSHRWTFTSRILEGGYDHYLFDDETGKDESFDSRLLRPRTVQWQGRSSSYTIHHSAIHAAMGRAGTISLLIRGPAQKSRFLVTEPATGKSWWRYGSGVEGPSNSQLRAEDLRRYAHLVTAPAPTRHDTASV